MEKNPVTQGLHKKLIGGDNMEAALTVLAALRQEGYATSLHYLGEDETKPNRVDENFSEILEAVHLLAESDFDIFISLTPAQIGYAIDDETGEANAVRIGDRLRELASSRQIAEAAKGGRAKGGRAKGGRDYLMFEMAGYDYLEKTLMLRGRLARLGVPTAVTVQANLYRSQEDVRALIADRATIRLVKGGYSGDGETYLTDSQDIAENFLHLASIMLSDDAYVEGVLPIFATQDAGLYEELIPLLAPCGWTPGEYEFEMYYGVAPKLQARLKTEGHKVRIYVPYGKQWWDYTSNRLAEHPGLMKSAIGVKAKSKSGEVTE